MPKINLASDSKTLCYACDRPLKRNGDELEAYRVDTRDHQTVFVGPECFRKIKAAGDAGYQPPLGGPKLYLLR